ncbi:hypothetical protein AJ85_20620 [Alkalihalobacillus alcalophilus ATCC 27647 = CGMCC 1.3604]|uniref:Uncharacterized protein n=1 Tax=Alkalihalobacillus alcalophilus ATCC 27647 = CGMCC 1.3604 TaxID=1218173 RepID=A0A4S4JUY3_ALKAL|nr:hypothetical protein AJ85_20620 [Alkalihalobacillus alcalophilus ATCC 27647 = CGMCC 1.3604]
MVLKEEAFVILNVHPFYLIVNKRIKDFIFIVNLKKNISLQYGRTHLLRICVPLTEKTNPKYGLVALYKPIILLLLLIVFLL